jgi:enamine deaminase RidA (YjgF/YER057c/UK114 family)
MSPSARLVELGLRLPAVSAPAGAYVPAVRSGQYVYTAGQLPRVDGALLHTGTVGADVTVEQAASCARACTLNALAAVDAAIGLDRVGRIVKVVGYVASAPGFGDQPRVLDAASELLGQIFAENGTHVRSAIGAAALPMGAPVEIELVVEVAQPTAT